MIVKEINNSSLTYTLCVYKFKAKVNLSHEDYNVLLKKF